MATNAQKAQDNYEMFQFCRTEGGHEAYLRNMELAQRYYASKQWLDSDMKTRTDEGRLSFVINETFRTINAVRGELNQLSSDVRFDPLNGDPAVAAILNKLNEHVDRQNKTYIHDDLVLLDGLLGGRGYYECRVKFDDNLQGNIDLRRKRPQNVVLPYNIDSPDTETWDRVFTHEVVSIADIENMYGNKISGKEFGSIPFADWLEPSDRTLAQSIGYNSAFDPAFNTAQVKQHRLISQQYREYKYKMHFVDQVTGDMSEIPENWSDQKISNALHQFNLGTYRKKVKTIRWRVTCNSVVLHDEDSPYKHFTIVPFLPWMVDGHPIALFDVLKGPQDLLNYTVSEETHILGTTAHAGWKIKQGSLRNMTMRQLERKGSKTGVILELEDVEDAQRITPGQPATGFERFGDRARGWINDLGSVSPSMLGSQGQHQNGEATQASLSRAPVNLHAPLLAFQHMKHVLAERKLNLFQTYYTETRILHVATSAYGKPEEVGINMPTAEDTIANNLTVGKYAVRMLPVGSRLMSDEYAFDELVQMKELGINVPNSLFVITSSVNAKADVMEQLLEANGGELSPEEQEAKELELEQMRLAVEDTRAGIEGKTAAAELARGRARRAEMDASFDPRTARADLDNRRLESEHVRGVRQIETKAEQDARNAALKLTELAVKAGKEEAKPKPVAKTAAKKVAKKAPKKQPR